MPEDYAPGTGLVVHETVDPAGISSLNSTLLNEHHFYMNDVAHVDAGLYEDVPHHVRVRVFTMGYKSMVQLTALRCKDGYQAVRVMYIVIPGTLEA